MPFGDLVMTIDGLGEEGDADTTNPAVRAAVDVREQFRAHSQSPALGRRFHIATRRVAAKAAAERAALAEKVRRLVLARPAPRRNRALANTRRALVLTEKALGVTTAALAEQRALAKEWRVSYEEDTMPRELIASLGSLEGVIEVDASGLGEFGVNYLADTEAKLTAELKAKVDAKTAEMLGGKPKAEATSWAAVYNALVAGNKKAKAAGGGLVIQLFNNQMKIWLQIAKGKATSDEKWKSAVSFRAKETKPGYPAAVTAFKKYLGEPYFSIVMGKLDKWYGSVPPAEAQAYAQKLELKELSKDDPAAEAEYVKTYGELPAGGGEDGEDGEGAEGGFPVLPVVGGAALLAAAVGLFIYKKKTGRFPWQKDSLGDSYYHDLDNDEIADCGCEG